MRLIQTQLSEEAFRPTPFLKWAGGKSRLLPQMQKFFPTKPKVYFEPFVGGGAVFLHLASAGLIKKAFLNDLNPDLVNLYCVIKTSPTDFIKTCLDLSAKYISLNELERTEFYYIKRKKYNSGKGYDSVTRAAATVFLNKTCFNGLFRVNSKGKFNVPVGRYKSPTIIEPENIFAVSRILNSTEAEITCLDFEEALLNSSSNSFIYYDPPYRPLNKTSSFTAYALGGFDDAEQTRLAENFNKLSAKNVLQMLSNSDPKNTNPEDLFFEELYSKHKIHRVKASRSINSKGAKRGTLNELLITNY